MPYRCLLLCPCIYRLHQQESPSCVVRLILKLWRIRLRCGIRLGLRFLQHRQLLLSSRIHRPRVERPALAWQDQQPPSVWSLTEMEVAE